MSTTVITSENSAEFYAAKLNLAPIVEQPMADPDTSELSDIANVDANSDVVHEEEQKDDEIAPEKEAKQQEKSKSENPKLEKRFSELTRQREDAKREAQAEREARYALERRLAELEAKVSPKQQEAPRDEDVRPTPDKFTDAYKYAEALADWSARNAIKEDRARQAHSQLINGFVEKQAAFKAEVDDYEDALKSSQANLANEVRDAIYESDVGPQLLYHLAKHPEITDAWDKKPLATVLREFGRLEAQLSADKSKPIAEKPAAKLSKAPAPISPLKAVSSVADVPVDANGEFTGTFQQYVALRKAGKIK
jgi:hypothetical protein